MRLIRQTTYESTGGDDSQKQKTRKPFDLRIFRIINRSNYEQMTVVSAPVQRRKMIVIPWLVKIGSGA